jgi:hypothetical protein
MPTKKTPRAKRPSFLPLTGAPRVRSVDVEFDWFPGFALAQQQHSVASLHEAARRLGYASAPLEISTRSTEEMGRALSAFNLRVPHPPLGVIPLESAFQSSKVFVNGGPYLDLATKDPKTAKRDPRIQQTTSPMVRFHFGDQDFPLRPTTAFYDWLYIRALSLLNPSILAKLAERDGFTDIAFNPARSLNCQARSAALFVSFVRDGCKEPWNLDFDDFVQLSSYPPAAGKPAPVQTGF